MYLFHVSLYILLSRQRTVKSGYTSTKPVTSPAGREWNSKHVKCVFLNTVWMIESNDVFNTLNRVCCPMHNTVYKNWWKCSVCKSSLAMEETVGVNQDFSDDCPGQAKLANHRLKKECSGGSFEEKVPDTLSAACAPAKVCRRAGCSPPPAPRPRNSESGANPTRHVQLPMAWEKKRDSLLGEGR